MDSVSSKQNSLHRKKKTKNIIACLRVFPSLNIKAIEEIGDAPEISCGKHLVNHLSSELLSKSSYKKELKSLTSDTNVDCSLSKFSSTTKKPSEAWAQIQYPFVRDKPFEKKKKISKTSNSNTKTLSPSNYENKKVFPNVQQRIVMADIARKQNRLFYKCPGVNRKEYRISKKSIGQNKFPEAKTKSIAMNL